MTARTAGVAVAAFALLATFAWARGLSARRELVQPRGAPLADAAGQVTMRLTNTGRNFDFRLSGLERRALYAVRFNQDDHPVLRTARTDRKGRARFRFAGTNLPEGILEPIANRPIEVVTYSDYVAGARVLLGRLPLVDGFRYWGQPDTGGNTARLAGVADAGPFAVESAAFPPPSTTGSLDAGDTIVWYPGAGGTVAEGGPFPPVVFVHAAQFGAADYEDWGRTIASWGFVVAVLDHFDPPPAPDPLKPDGQGQVRTIFGAMDWLAAENADAGSRFFGQLRLDDFGLVGHSVGGGAAIVAAARSSSHGRVRAAVGLGPQPLYIQSGLFSPYVPYAPDAASGAWPPTLIVTGTRDALADPSACRERYFDPAPKPRAYVQIAGHCSASYADRVPAPAAAGSDYDAATCDEPEVQRRAARTYVIPWLLSHLRGEERVLDYVNGAYAAEQEDVVELSFD